MGPPEGRVSWSVNPSSPDGAHGGTELFHPEPPPYGMTKARLLEGCPLTSGSQLPGVLQAAGPGGHTPHE